MPTTKSDIIRWLDEAMRKGATHMIVVCDTFDWDDYPVHIFPEENVYGKYTQYQGKNMQKVMEVYNLNMDIEKQLLEHRSFNF